MPSGEVVPALTSMPGRDSKARANFTPPSRPLLTTNSALDSGEDVRPSLETRPALTSRSGRDSSKCTRSTLSAVPLATASNAK